MAAVSTAIVAGALGAIASSYQNNKQQQAQKKVQNQQQALIDKQNAQALATRKEQVNQQRAQLAGAGYNTSTTGETGIRGFTGNKLG